MHDMSQTFPFSLAWDHPIARFGSGMGLPRYYTRFFGYNGRSSANIAAFALLNVNRWISEINSWQVILIFSIYCILSCHTLGKLFKVSSVKEH